MVQWIDLPMEARTEQTIHALVEEQAALSPYTTAIEIGNRLLSYGQLNAQANAVARRLRGLGINRGALVGLCMERSPELIVGLLGILKAGAAYVPLDPDDPDKRRSFIIRDAGTPVIVAHRATASRLAPSLRQAKVFWVDSDELAVDHEDDANLDSQLSAGDIACVVYRSSSTSNPYGVMVCHGSVTCVLNDRALRIFAKDDVVLHHAPLSTDVATIEICGALARGARLVLMPPRYAGLEEFGTAIQRHGVTNLWLNAGLFHLLIEKHADGLRPLRRLLVEGDDLSPTHVHRALVTLRDSEILSVYGHAESMPISCWRRITKDLLPGYALAIGRPVASATVHVLDDEGRPVAPGASGELWIGGDCLARGYLNHPELTRRSFVADPFSTQAGARLYRTGDLALLRDDGEIHRIGRADNQVSILGRRIDPGEIEAALRQHPEIRLTAVAAVVGRRRVKRLVAYIVAVGPRIPSSMELTEYLARRLPRYMIPSLIVPIDELPVATNGKVDRSALPLPEPHEFGDAEFPTSTNESPGGKLAFPSRLRA
jgi:amino acid adenylation domain-containing protein